MNYIDEDYVPFNLIVLHYEVNHNCNTNEPINPPHKVTTEPMAQHQVQGYIDLLDLDCIGGIDAYDSVTNEFIGSTEL